MKYVMLYGSADDVLVKAPLYGAAHRARLEEFYDRGVLLMAGPFTNPVEGAIGIFTTREAAVEFIEGDPFVLNGVVRSWQIREGNEVLSPS